MRLSRGSLVVFEGLDNAGKSTQVDALSRLEWDAPTPFHTHMPSGLASLTEDIYKLTEKATFNSPLALQLLHLACHAESQEAILEAREQRGVFLDRWWWSTVAYGWYGAGLRHRMEEDVFFGMIDAVWDRVDPDVIFLFLDPFTENALNNDDVAEGYLNLKSSSTDKVVIVPMASVAETTDWLLSHMVERGLVRI